MMMGRMTVRTRGDVPAIVMNAMGLYEGDLVHYFRAVFNNARNLMHPYHNFRHLLHVMYLCHDACLFYSEQWTPRQMRNLLIAALFHDFDHTGKSGDDDVNISFAIHSLAEHIADEDREHLDEIVEIIKATRYPYKVPSGELPLQMQVIRDADLSQSLSVAWIQQIAFGLAEEWGISPLEVLKKQESFHRSLVFHTKWAQDKFPSEVVEEKISEVRDLLNLLTGEPERV